MHCVPIFAIFGLKLNSLYRYKMILKLFCDSVILLDTRTCIILFYFRYSHITSDDNVPVLQFIVDIFEILKYSNNR